MSDSQGVTETALAELAGLLLSTKSFEDLMRQCAELAARLVPAAVTCGITLADSGRVLTVASSNSLGLLLDEQQYQLDEGPCLQALSTGTIVSAEDLYTEDRWGSYPQRAVVHGVFSVYASPLVAHEQVLGVLNMYGGQAHAFDQDSRDATAMLARLTSTIMTAALRHYDEVTLTDHLRTALSSRSVIDQAMGIVMAMQRCDPAGAFDRLRAISQHRNVPLREIAGELVANNSDSAAAP